MNNKTEANKDLRFKLRQKHNAEKCIAPQFTAPSLNAAWVVAPTMALPIRKESYRIKCTNKI